MNNLPERGNSRNALLARSARSNCRYNRMSSASKVFERKKNVAFATAIIEQALSLKPSQVFAFPDVHANIDADLIKYGVAVTTDDRIFWVFLP